MVYFSGLKYPLSALLHKVIYASLSKLTRPSFMLSACLPCLLIYTTCSYIYVITVIRCRHTLLAVVLLRDLLSYDQLQYAIVIGQDTVMCSSA